MSDPITQLREYGDQLDRLMPGLSGLVEPAFGRSQQRRARPGWVVALATAAAVLIVIGGVSLLLGGSGESVEPADQPPSSAPVAPALTTPMVTPTMAPTEATPTSTPAPTIAGSRPVVSASPAGTTTLHELGCVADIELDSTGSVWAACDDSLYRLGGESWAEVPAPKGTFDFDFATGDVLVALSWDDPAFSLSTWDGNEWITHPIESGWAIDAAPDGSVWAATRQPALRFDLDRGWEEIAGTTTPAPTGYAEPLEWLDVSVGDDGTVWLDLDLGAQVYRWDGSLSKVGEGYEQIWSAPDGSLWARTSPEAFGRPWGIDQYTGGTWVRHPLLDDVFVLDVSFADDGIVWVATDGDGLYRYDGTEWVGFGVEAGIPPTVNSVAVERESVWVGTSTGLIQFDPSS